MRNSALVVVSLGLCASNATANSLSWNTQMSCASDYYAYCSMHKAGSAGCHACMRANRLKLSETCVAALIDDGVLKRSSAAQRKTKSAVAAAKSKAASRVTARREANPVAKTSTATTAAADTPPKADDAMAFAHPVPPVRAPETPAPTPPPKVEQAAPAIDQKTFEALKNREPYFLPMDDIASRFSRAQ